MFGNTSLFCKLTNKHWLRHLKGLHDSCSVCHHPSMGGHTVVDSWTSGTQNSLLPQAILGQRWLWLFFVKYDLVSHLKVCHGALALQCRTTWDQHSKISNSKGFLHFYHQTDLIKHEIKIKTLPANAISLCLSQFH